MKTIKTTTLNDGTKVLAGKDRAGYFGAKTYTNYKQANAMIEKLVIAGVDARLYDTRGPAKYIVIN